MRPSVWRDLALITLGGLVLRLCYVDNPGHVVDLRTFGNWALAAADNPWNRAYEVTDANYPPGALLFFELIGRCYRALGLSDAQSLRIALKLPNVIFDLVGGGVLFAIAARFVDARQALWAAVLYDANPAIIYNSSLWGQNDSITTVTALIAIWCMIAQRRVAAWVILAFAVLNKPPVVVFAPLFMMEALVQPDADARRRAVRQTILGIAGAIVCGYLVAAPFYTDRSVWGVYTRMIGWYGIGSALYPFNSANAFNLYALFGDFFQSDAVPIGFLPLRDWAHFTFVAIAAIIVLRYTRIRDQRAVLEATYLLMLGFFLVLTEMHERYLIYALTIVPALALIDRRYLWSALVLTLTEWLNLEYSLTYMWLEFDKPQGIDYNEFAPVLVHLCALANLATFGVGLRTYFTRHAASRNMTGTALERP